MSLTLNILQTLGVQPPPLHWLCDSFFPHPSGSYWEAGQAACSHTWFLERWPAPVCWSNPDCRPLFPVALIYTQCQCARLQAVHSFTQELWDLSERTDTNMGAFWKFFPHLLQWLLFPYPVKSVWFAKVQLKTPGLTPCKRCFVPQGTANLSTDPCCVNRACWTDATNRQQQAEALSRELLEYLTDNGLILHSGAEADTHSQKRHHQVSSFKWVIYDLNGCLHYKSFLSLL